MSYRYEAEPDYEPEYYAQHPRRWRRGCLIAAVVLVWVLVLGCLVLRFWVQPAITDFVNNRIARTINPDVSPNLDPVSALRDSLAGIRFGLIPPGRYEITEVQANAYLAAYRSELGGFDQSRVRFVPGEAHADLTWRGFTSTARTGAVARDGQIQAVNPRLDPPLGALLSINALVNVLQDRINNELAAQGRRVTDLEIRQGVAVVTVE